MGPSCSCMYYNTCAFSLSALDLCYSCRGDFHCDNHCLLVQGTRHTSRPKWGEGPHTFLLEGATGCKSKRCLVNLVCNIFISFDADLEELAILGTAHRLGRWCWLVQRSSYSPTSASLPLWILWCNSSTTNKAALLHKRHFWFEFICNREVALC